MLAITAFGCWNGGKGGEGSRLLRSTVPDPSQAARLFLEWSSFLNSEILVSWFSHVQGKQTWLYWNTIQQTTVSFVLKWREECEKGRLASTGWECASFLCICHDCQEMSTGLSNPSIPLLLMKTLWANQSASIPLPPNFSNTESCLILCSSGFCLAFLLFFKVDLQAFSFWTGRLMQLLIPIIWWTVPSNVPGVPVLRKGLNYRTVMAVSIHFGLCVRNHSMFVTMAGFAVAQ